MLIKLALLIIKYLGKTNNLILLLSRVEYGVSIFLEKIAKQTLNEWKNDLYTQIIKHSLEEKNHGKMLASIAEGKDKIPFKGGTGIIISARRPNGENLLINPKYLINSKPINWQSEFYVGETIAADFVNLDGISRRYLSFKIFFGGKHADEYEWVDKLAFMLVLEDSSSQFYRCLAEVYKNSPLGNIALKISNEEIGHKEYLSRCLELLTEYPEECLNKWRARLLLAYFGLIIDIFKLNV